MGFATPLALLLLAALSLPWLVHRMRQRDLTTVQLPTIALLQRALAVTQRRRALEDLLLMLTRMSLIALLALALAAPFVWSRATFTSGEPLSLAIVIDDSMSMLRQGGGGTLLDEAIEQTRTTIEALPPSSQVAVILAGRPPRTLAALGDPQAAIAAIDTLTVSPGRGTELTHATQLADAALSAATHARRRVLVLSDLAGNARATTQSDIDIHYVRLSDAATDNLAIVAAKATRDAATGDSFIIDVDVIASRAQSNDIRVELRDERAVLTTVTARFDGTRTRVMVPVTAEHARDRDHVTVKLVTSDALTIDNERAVLLRDALDRHVLLVNGDPRPTHSSDELHFLSRALQVAPHAGVALGVEVTDSVGLAHVALDATDLIWLANVEAPSADTVKRLREHVESGGGLVISAGDNVQVAAYDARLSQLLPARIEGVETVKTLDFDAQHASADAWGIAAQAIGHAQTHKRLITSGGKDVVLRYADGAPALLRHSVGSGRVALWTTSIDADWTDLPFRPGFLALTSSLVHALAPHANDTTKVEPGQAQRVITASAREATLIDPAGQRSALQLDGRYALVSDRQTRLPGAYRVEALDDNGVTRVLPRAAFVVAPPSDESDLTQNPVPQPANDTTTAIATRVRRPLDAWLFLALAPLFLIEAVLRSRRTRGAVHAAARTP